MTGKGRIHIYYGAGKGKTTAAVGQIIRAAGCGLKILMFQYLKNNDSNERSILEQIPNITCLPGRQITKFVNQMNNFELSIEDAFEGITMFGVASYGFDVSGKALGSDEKIQPSMVELPFLWTLAKLGLIKVSKLSAVKGFLGKEKITSEMMTDLQELYVK